MKAKKSTNKKNRIYVSVIAAFVIFAILMCFAVALVNCKDYFISQLDTIGKDLGNENYDKSVGPLDDMLEGLDELAVAISNRNDVVNHDVENSTIGDIVRAFATNHPTARMRLLSPTKYDVMTVGDCGDLDLSKIQTIGTLADQGVKGNTGLYFDSLLAAQTVAYFTPVKDTPDVIGIIMYVTVEDVQAMINFRSGDVPPSYATFIDVNGYKVTEQYAEGFSTDRLTSFYDTLDRLSISERCVFACQAVYNTFIYLFLWAVELAVCFGLCVYYTKAMPDAVIGNQTIFLAFYRNELLHALLPLSDVFVWIRNIFLIFGLSIATAEYPHKQRHKKIGASAIVMAVFTVIFFKTEPVNSFNTAIIIVTGIINAIEMFYYFTSGEDGYVG